MLAIYKRNVVIFQFFIFLAIFFALLYVLTVIIVFIAF